VVFSLLSGSRTAEDQQVVAAAFGSPGRTTITGSRIPRPSTQPRRVYSFSMSSHTTLLKPYVLPGNCGAHKQALASL